MIGETGGRCWSCWRSNTNGPPSRLDLHLRSANSPKGQAAGGIDNGMRIALVHYWLLHMRGGEKVLEALCRMFPSADIFTHVYAPEGMAQDIRTRRVQTTFIAKLPLAKTLYKTYLPLMPYALEGIDLSAYDLVISSESGPAKGIVPGPGAVHVCYCHSPMRYIWDLYHVYRNNAGLLAKMAMPFVGHELRKWDVTSAARVDKFVANSSHVANRIAKYYRRDSVVVHPPVAVEAFAPVATNEVGDFYLWAGELVAYKRPDLAIEAFNRMRPRKLVVIGDGEERKKLQRIAKDNISFLGRVEFDTLKEYFARCRALVFPGEEDFGIVPVEVMASGRPVIAYGKGGVLDTVIDGETGSLFYSQEVEDLIATVERFEAEQLIHVDPIRLRAHAHKYDQRAFAAGIGQVLEQQGVYLNYAHSD